MDLEEAGRSITSRIILQYLTTKPWFQQAWDQLPRHEQVDILGEVSRSMHQFLAAMPSRMHPVRFQCSHDAECFIDTDDRVVVEKWVAEAALTPCPACYIPA